MRLGVDAAVVDGQLLAGDVEVADDTIARLALPAAGTGLVAAPGFVDLQINGFGGIDLLNTDAEGVRAASRALLATGVTAWQPTLVTSPEPVATAAVRAVSKADQRGEGAAIIGVHLEGPFLASQRLGTHNAAHRRDPDRRHLERLLDAGPITQVTLAPELPGSGELIDLLVARGITVAAGHTDATATQAHAAFDRGITTVTHLFNAMRRFRPREAGVAGAALVREDVSVQAIVDGHHLADDTVRLVWRAAAGRLALVTDAIAAAGLGDGATRLGDVAIEVRDGVARRADGTLAGSVLTMPDAVRNLAALGIPLAAAVDAATMVPARIAGRDDIGRVAPGACADLVVLDESLALRRVLRRGREVDDA